ncbi:MAG: HTH domain-containing protein [Polyangiaceae bacterium]
MRRRARLFAIAEYLRGRRTGVTAETIAERFGISVRTAYRDLESLKEAELPIRAERGRGGGYALDRAYTLPPVNLSPREAALLLTVGRFATELRVVPFVETLASALDKVRGALDASAQRELARDLERLSFTGVPAAAAPSAVRRAVEQAWFEKRPLVMTYLSADNIEQKRRVRIDGVVFERSLTLLNCDDLDKKERRQFRLDRILAAHVVTDDR